MRSHRGQHWAFTLYYLHRYATLQRPIGKGTDAGFEKEFDHRRNTKQRRGRQGCSRNRIKVVKSGVSTSTTTAAPITNALAVMQIGSNPHSVSMPATPSKNRGSGTLVDLSLFRRNYAEKSQLQARNQFIPSHLRKWVAAKRKNNLKHLEPRIMFECKSAGALNGGWNKCPHNKQRCRAHYLNLWHYCQAIHQKKRGAKSRKVNSGTSSRTQEASIESESLALLQASYLENIQLFASLIEVFNNEEIPFDWKGEITLTSAKSYDVKGAI